VTGIRRRDVWLAALAVVACSRTPPPAPSAAAAADFFVSGDARLSYRIDLPAGSPPFPAVVLGHGSGRLTKDDMRWLASGFVRHGYAALSYDKRGVGQSTGEYSGVGVTNSERMFALLAGDMVAAVSVLRADPRIDRARIGLAGNSQAGWFVPVAAIDSNAAFIVLVSGPTVSVGEENYYSDLVENTTLPLEEGYAKFQSFDGPRGFDPRPVLDRLHIPGLWLFGSDDRSIPVRTSVAVLESLTTNGRSHPFSWHVYPGQGHSLFGYWDDVYRWLDERR
jgi:pimeloyl-ACP methyl ester carboxylesterase